MRFLSGIGELCLVFGLLLIVWVCRTFVSLWGAIPALVCMYMLYTAIWKM